MWWRWINEEKYKKQKLQDKNTGKNKLLLQS